MEKTVLAIDEDISAQNLYRRIFPGDEFRLEVFDDAAGALRRMAGKRFNVLLVGAGRHQ